VEFFLLVRLVAFSGIFPLFFLLLVFLVGYSDFFLEFFSFLFRAVKQKSRAIKTLMSPWPSQAAGSKSIFFDSLIGAAVYARGVSGVAILR
jgi:hypothetical protein